MSPLLAGNAIGAPIGLFAAAANPSPGADPDSRAAAYAVVFPAVGVGVDLLTGAGYKLPSRVHVTLESQNRSTKTR